MEGFMTPVVVSIIGVGVALLSAVIAAAGFIIFLMSQSEKRSVERINRLEDRMNQQFLQMEDRMNQRFLQMEDRMNQRFLQMEDRMNQRFDQQDTRFDRLEDQQKVTDERLRNLEQGQAYLSGQFSELKDYFVHRPGSE